MLRARAVLAFFVESIDVRLEVVNDRIAGRNRLDFKQDSAGWIVILPQMHPIRIAAHLVRVNFVDQFGRIAHKHFGMKLPVFVRLAIFVTPLRFDNTLAVGLAHNKQMLAERHDNRVFPRNAILPNLAHFFEAVRIFEAAHHRMKPLERQFAILKLRERAWVIAAALATRAVRDGDHYVLNGQKQFISGAGAGDLYVVMVRTGGSGPSGISTLVVPGDTPGLSLGANERKMGWNAQPTRAVIFQDARVPVANRLGEEGIGFKIAMAGLDGGRLNIAACSLGGAQNALDKTLAYMKERKAFGKRLDEFQALRFRLADMAIALEASRTFLWRAAAALDRKDPSATRSAPWPSASSPTPVSMSPTRRCNCMAATAICPNSASRRSCAICACTRSSKEPTSHAPHRSAKPRRTMSGVIVQENFKEICKIEGLQGSARRPDVRE